MTIDMTPIGHALIAAAVQAAWGLAVGDWWAGAVIGTAIFVGREHAQAEYQYIAIHGGLRYMAPWPPELGALHPLLWRRTDVLDLAAPAAATLIIAGVMHAFV
ncbi:hypothetical protein [Pelomicrobium methylotrophicum]|uniref:Uncharacterized protein n=1 Tax=Pelomicrobium methylotrophicum TaxID=2602750 RepID=A0A5C7EKD4_9PROT|nr:hypothetical protein [Pelomicrobium methylotrophicum]TXF11941.1 hypothetical protein FR698_08030 [Pelomicrobium methylotrophicum]